MGSVPSKKKGREGKKEGKNKGRRERLKHN
jgi:hypothetical protein